VVQLKVILVTVREAAQLLGVCVTTIYELLKTDPTFPRPIYIGRSPRFIVDELLEWVLAKQSVQLQVGRASNGTRRQAA